MSGADSRADLVVVGAGAAGLMTAIWTARMRPQARVVAIDGASRLGAKILVSGGGRCNVTHDSVAAEDYWGGSRNVIRRVLAAFDASATVAYFRELGVELHREEGGKLFPDSNSARTVLVALLGEAERLGVKLCTGQRGVAVRAGSDGGFQVERQGGMSIEARCVALCTGGLSLPKTGSDGAGYEIARSLGHGLVATTPALAGLVLGSGFHAALSGVSQPVQLTVHVGGSKPTRLRGDLLWTHFGVSGPVALDASRHWHRAMLEGKPVRVSASFAPEEEFATFDARMIREAAASPRTPVRQRLAEQLPQRLADALLDAAKIDRGGTLAHLSRESRRRLAHVMLELPLTVVDSRGYKYAEATAGGIPLGEIDPRTMESRVAAGLFFAGEILDVDGRLGGFNFQWAWSSGFVAAGGVAARLSAADAGAS